MRKIFFSLVSIGFLVAATAQETVYPAPKQSTTIVITNATVHKGNGEVIENANIVITDGKIAAVGKDVTVPSGATTVDAKGKQVYPGLILPVTDLGLVEMPSVRATTDVQEIGDLNPNVRSIVAYNTDSKVINTLRSNGILLAGITPQGGVISGSSSIVQLDAWNWEERLIRQMKEFISICQRLCPSPFCRIWREAAGGPQQQERIPPSKKALRVERSKAFSAMHRRMQRRLLMMRQI